MLAALRRVWEHLAWADGLLLSALDTDPPPPPEALREYAHILGADETWLSRLERRSATAPVWPDMDVGRLREFARGLHAGYFKYLSGLDAAALSDSVAYTNSAGLSFVSSVQDILLHVALHAQYHRGKVNLRLRDAGRTPAATDYIAFVRGVPAATTSGARS
jgi:uncharacterized damage-inducible protein DinB